MRGCRRREEGRGAGIKIRHEAVLKIACGLRGAGRRQRGPGAARPGVPGSLVWSAAAAGPGARPRRSPRLSPLPAGKAGAGSDLPVSNSIIPCLPPLLSGATTPPASLLLFLLCNQWDKSGKDARTHTQSGICYKSSADGGGSDGAGAAAGVAESGVSLALSLFSVSPLPPLHPQISIVSPPPPPHPRPRSRFSAHLWAAPPARGRVGGAEEALKNHGPPRTATHGN